MEKSRKIIESYQVVSMTPMKNSDGLRLSEAKIDTSKAMLVVIDAICAGMTANYHNFLPSALSAAAASYYTPYHKPLIKNHDSYSAEPMGRIFDAKYLPETHVVRVWAYVQDEDAIQKIKDGRYQTVSIGCMAADARCSICGHDYFAGECMHWAGGTYDEGLCMVNIYECEFSELSFVNVPACDTAGVVDFGGEVPEDLRDPSAAMDMAHESDERLALVESAGAEQPLKVSEISEKHKEIHQRFEAIQAEGGEVPSELATEHAEIVKLMQGNHMHHTQIDALDAAVVEPVTETVVEPAAEPVTETTEPVTEATEPVAEPVVEATEPAAEPVTETVVEPVVEPVIEATEPAAEPVVEATEPAAEPIAEAVKTPVEAAVAPQPIASGKPATLETEAATVIEGKPEVNQQLQQQVESLGSEIDRLKGELEALERANVETAVLLHNTLTDRVIELKLSMELITPEETEATRQSLQFRSAETLSGLVEGLLSQSERQAKPAVQQFHSGVSDAESHLVEVPTLVTEAGQASPTPTPTDGSTLEERVRFALNPRQR